MGFRLSGFKDIGIEGFLTIGVGGLRILHLKPGPTQYRGLNDSNRVYGFWDLGSSLTFFGSLISYKKGP